MENTPDRVILVHRDRYLVRHDVEELYCVLAGNLRYRDEFPVVGDEVEITVNPYGDSLIRTILPRRTVFCRPDRGGHADGFVKTMQVQPLVANMDYVFIITSLNQDFSLSRIARYAAMATAGGAIPVAILTKADVCPDAEAMEAKVSALSEGLEAVSVSSYTGFGLERLKKYLMPGTTIALLGSSGAGKSTLINTLAGREVMRTSEIREEDAKGRHTTTHREMIDLNGVYLIDTPGLRELGMIDAETGLADTFSDIAELITRCAFSDCRHQTEPGCAVRQALQDGTLSPERWEMYSRLEQENNWSKTKKNEKMMKIAMWQREYSRAGIIHR
ncbi:MAG: ribosome small subunit-dependent GTPase A [Clostridia bacterium]|nr:ribosome small subunit-dependent GTPase A [Clostridia bacterium]